MMKMSLVTDILDYLSFDEMVPTVAKLGFEAVELGCGNWSKAPHIQLDTLLESQEARKNLLESLERHNLSIAALNCSGNPLHPGPSGAVHRAVTEKTFQLAEKLGVKTIVMMSGCPGAIKTDTMPSWVAQVFLPEHQNILEYQWHDVLIPYFENVAKLAKNSGVRVAIENHGYNLVHNPVNIMKLRQYVDPVIGLNYDPSHLMWMGGDAIAALRYLGDAIHYLHAKDVRIERMKADVNGLIDTYHFSELEKRAWNYVALGHGHDVQWWKEFFAIAKMVGYTGPVSLEMEDVNMEPIVGVKKSLETLKLSLPRCFEH